MNLDDVGFMIVMDAILQLESLEELTLKVSKNPDLSPEPMKQFLQRLNEMGSLKRLDLSTYLCEKIYDFPKMEEILTKVAEKTFHH